MARILAEGQVDELDDAAIVKIRLSRAAIPDALAQLSSLRYAVAGRLRVKLATGILEIRLDEALRPGERARINSSDAGLRLDLSGTELDVWLAFLASCYWLDPAPVDHVDLSAFDSRGVEYMVTLAVETSVDLKSPGEARRALGLE